MRYRYRARWAVGLLSAFLLLSGCGDDEVTKPPAGPAYATHLVLPDGTGDFPTIQDAIHAAAEGDTIELANGTFTGDGNWDMDYLGKAVTVRSQGAHRSSCVIDGGGSMDVPHRGFRFHSGEGPESVLRGIVIMGCVADSGAGILCEDSSPTLLDLSITENFAFFWGGGMYCRTSSPALAEISFLGNSAEYHGGGMSCRYGSSPGLTDVLFHGNRAMSWAWGGIGGGLCSWDSSPTLTRVTFRENAAGVSGGGMACGESSPVLTDVGFYDNEAAPFWGTRGGGLYCLQSSPSLAGVTLAGNTAAADGGGIYCGASTGTLSSVTLYGNGAEKGGGISCLGSSYLSLEKVIIAMSPGGEAFYCDRSSSASLVCCDLYGNAGGDWLMCIGSQFGMNGNISEDPLFCDPGNGDLHLEAGSPCAPGGECGVMGAWAVGCDTP